MSYSNSRGSRASPGAQVSPPGEGGGAEGRLDADQMFGRYRVVRDLGAGGMAQVFVAAIDGAAGFQKLCVVKRILPQYARDPKFAEMFINEARVAAMMSHQNIVQVFEFSEDNDEFFMAMEYVSGTSLGRLAKMAKRSNMTLGPRVAVEVGVCMAKALSYAHAMVMPDGTPLKIVHRDVTPENILVSREGGVKLTDFGVVKSETNVASTVAGVVKGKWAYMSPEQVSSRPLDGRSDLFSLGVVMWELCAGKRLFAANSPAASVTAVLNGEIPPLSSIIPDFPAPLDRIIQKALSRNADKRYQTGAEMAAALEQFRGTHGWPGGSEHLSAVVNALVPKEGSVPGAALLPGSGASDVEELGTEFESGARVEAGPSPETSVPPWVILAGAAALVGSALFWFLLD